MTAPKARPDVAGEDMSREQFIERFVARMMAVTGGTDGEGEPVEPYARETAGSYFDERWQRIEGPETCADTDLSYWED